MAADTYTHLLAAVDFEPGGEPVLARAQQLATRLGARLTLLHVLEPIPAAPDYLPLGFGGDLPVPDDSGLEQELREFAVRQLDAVGERLGVPVSERLVRIGATAQTVDEVAAEIGADLVVIGSRGRHGFLALFGSTAKAVLRGAQCDVLCVKLAEEEST
jgi:universal stress protein A